MGMFFLYLYLCAPHTCLMHVESEESFGFPGTGLADGCEPLHGFWERKLTLQQEQQVLLNAEPSLQSIK